MGKSRKKNGLLFAEGGSRDPIDLNKSSDRIGTKILSLNKGKKRKKNENDKTVKYV